MLNELSYWEKHNYWEKYNDWKEKEKQKEDIILGEVIAAKKKERPWHLRLGVDVRRERPAATGSAAR